MSDNFLKEAWRLAKRVYSEGDSIRFMENPQPTCLGLDKTKDEDALKSPVQLIEEGKGGMVIQYLQGRVDKLEHA